MYVWFFCQYISLVSFIEHFTYQMPLELFCFFHIKLNVLTGNDEATQVAISLAL